VVWVESDQQRLLFARVDASGQLIGSPTLISAGVANRSWQPTPISLVWNGFSYSLLFPGTRSIEVAQFDRTSILRFDTAAMLTLAPLSLTQPDDIYTGVRWVGQRGSKYLTRLRTPRRPPTSSGVAVSESRAVNSSHLVTTAWKCDRLPGGGGGVERRIATGANFSSFKRLVARCVVGAG
jgi:hypothetical protein